MTVLYNGSVRFGGERLIFGELLERSVELQGTVPPSLETDITLSDRKELFGAHHTG